jgi:hypothetical protein
VLRLDPIDWSRRNLMMVFVRFKGALGGRVSVLGVLGLAVVVPGNLDSRSSCQRMLSGVERRAKMANGMASEKDIENGV